MVIDSVHKALRAEGYAKVSAVDLTDVVDCARSLGEISMDHRSPDPIRRISPQPLDSAKENTLSSRYGYKRFPFHTDVAHWERPADFVCLYCENVGKGRRPTELIDTSTWNMGRRFRVSLLSCLWKSGYVRPRLCTVGSKQDGTIRFRYDLGCMEPYGKQSAVTQAEIECLISSSHKVTIEWEGKTLLVIDNSRVLHARGNSARPDPDRVLFRVLVGGRQ